MTTDPPVSPVPDAAPTAPPEQSQPIAPSSATPPTRRAWLLPTATGAAGLLLGAALMGGITTAQAVAAERAEAEALAAAEAAADQAAEEARAARSALLTDAVEACDVTYAPGITLGDEGASITFDMRGEDEAHGADYLDIACLFAELDMPSAVASHVDQTTSMDGRQQETWDNLTVSWSYHPDRGLDGVLTVTDS